MDVVNFALHVQSLNTLSAISQALSDLTRPLGFPTHAISPVPTPDRPVEDAIFLVQNWPKRWGHAYEAEGFAAFDPIPRAAVALSAHAATLSAGVGFGTRVVVDTATDGVVAVASATGGGVRPASN